ncbi:fluoride efflux transporter CrcB [Phreatobacter stygius]|uniref:Fluoride-specific ion channel FluC n=1 Tax=Phreatobacter stygius TaxID=1940610 RepID=A0A4D7AZB1_9HYPH|nr:fluoride efflux transporter CrcB [Phreatobacter stygius]QCI66794.1 fluoride efflux transporter CrcB [Phreatobacter stygius]
MTGVNPTRATDRMRALKVYWAVGCGAAIGSLLRFLSGELIVSALGLSALVTTAVVNVVGSFVIMVFATLTGPDGRLLVGATSRQFVMAGLCGGFTTFSAMSLDAFILLLEGDIALALAYLAAVVGLSLAAAWFGFGLAVRINR